MALLLLQQNATVTVCHSKTQNLSEITAQADVLIAAIGKPNFVKKEMVKQGAIVVDVGINRTENGIVGDVDPAVQEVALYLSPVPGGVGPMTIAMLMKNTLIAARRQCE
jgi:methylenetetrahydrofolate dehydrogenase (NADP+)/methenyltetrahydrofolate cyclohydrolase